MEPSVIFPCLLYREILDVSDEYNSQLTREIEHMGILETSFFASDRLFENSVFTHLTEHITRAVNEYARMVGTDRTFRIHSMWANYSKKGACMGTHTHGTHPISGVYYINIPKCPEGYFLRFIYDKWTLRGNEWDEPLESKKLLLFEGWVLHGYAPNPSNEPKIAISFNFEFS